MADTISRKRTIHPSNDRDPNSVDTIRKIAQEEIRGSIKPQPVMYSSQRRSNNNVAENSTRELIAGTNISFDDSLPGKRTINGSGGSATRVQFYATDSAVLDISAGQFTDGVRTDFDLSDAPTDGTIELFRNGQQQLVGIDYSITTNVITIITNGAPSTSESISGFYWS